MNIQIPGQPGDVVTNVRVIIENILFSSPKSGWTVITVRPYGHSKGSYVFTAVGTIGEVRIGGHGLLSGEWVTTPKYGIQMQITSFDPPEITSADMQEQLLNGDIPGVGPKLGRLIWEAFGDSCVQIFDETPELLLSIKGIKEARLEKIKNSWWESRGKRVAAVEFRKLGLHGGIINGIFRRWQNPSYALAQVRQNPFLLAWEISGVGFQTADTVAKLLGFQFDCHERVGAALGFALHSAAQNEGHCYLPATELFRRANELLAAEFDSNFFQNILVDLEQAGRVVFLKNQNNLCVYLKSLANAEYEVAIAIKKLSHQQGWYPKNLSHYIAEYENATQITLHKNQKEAVKLACENQCSVITGGPGTGKTTIIKCLIAVLKKVSPDINIALAAPTGRAAKRMTESTGFEAKTIHRLLSYSPHEGFIHNEENPLVEDVVIVDESSMLDIRLADKLLAALKNGSRIVFVGDVNQLPSVGAGSVLKDIIASGRVPVAFLSQIYRQSEGSFIAYNAKAILDGNFNALNLSNRTDDFFFMGVNDPRLDTGVRQEMIKTGLLKCVHRLLEKGYSLGDIQILCPMKSGAVGVNFFNVLLQKVFNPTGQVVFQGERLELRVGDKVMQIRNNYDKDIFNGDQGVVEGCDEDGVIFIRFDSRILEYTPKDINEIVLSYAMTVHKAQGSEAKVAIVVLSQSHHVMLSRSIFYTAVTRAREMCVLVGEMVAVKKAININKSADRNTNLTHLLAGRINMALAYAA